MSRVRRSSLKYFVVTRRSGVVVNCEILDGQVGEGKIRAVLENMLVQKVHIVYTRHSLYVQEVHYICSWQLYETQAIDV